jgi:NAD(P)-dependent dehydrogenase (short-subunit alcohol dehydrogenase family)
MAQLPPHFGTSFTPTIHSRIPSNLNPTNLTLPQPCVVVVTGAGKGLGYHISLAYAKAGCSGLAISSRTMEDLDALDEAVKKISGGKTEVLKTVCDVQSDESVQELERSVREKWGRVDVVVANAGIISKYVDKEREKGKENNLPVGIVEDDDWSRVLNINLLGVWRLSKSCARKLV